MIPYIIPKNNLISSILIISVISTFADSKMISISSLVDKYIDIRVPRVIILVMYRFVAITEKPHCGIIPRSDPIIGPIFFDLVIIFLFLLVNLCSSNSIIKNATSKNGIIFNESIMVSNIISFIISSVFNYSICLSF